MRLLDPLHRAECGGSNSSPLCPGTHSLLPQSDNLTHTFNEMIFPEGVQSLQEPPLSLVILARCLAGNQPSGPLREEGGGDVSLLGMRPLYFADIQQEQHSHHL
ncbi:unnamed protein product [Pleuronectes platessa]|uniref:Uncharacterized protein n=1 Tax=Pleuronectes platessa TaxID=8262 RepID=A0A9N7US01_PLEPL|nr:unnamed protein product [Pleuronectes platessa]